MNFDIADRIIIYLDCNKDYKEAIEKNLSMIKEETLALDIIEKNNIEMKLDVNDYKIGIELEKVNNKE